MKQFAALRLKTYSYLTESNDKDKNKHKKGFHKRKTEM